MSCYQKPEVYALVVLSNLQHQWGLTEEQLQDYSEAITALNTSTTVRLESIISYYHCHHDVVRILLTNDDPQNTEQWLKIQADVRGTIITHNQVWTKDNAWAIEDLCQTVLAEVLVSLPKYRYRSAFGTWMRSLIIQRVWRIHRDNNAQKRPKNTLGIDAAIDIPYHTQDVDAAAIEKELYQMIHAILSMERNKKLSTIMFLRLLDEQTAIEIGRAVALHPSRVRSLLAHIRVVLLRNPLFREWFGDALPELRDDQNDEDEGDEPTPR